MSTNRNRFSRFNEEDIGIIDTAIGKGSEERMVGTVAEASGGGVVESWRNLERPDVRGISVQREISVSRE